MEPHAGALPSEGARAQADAVRQRREAEALARSARLLTETLDMETVGRRTVDIVRDLFEVPSAGIRLRDLDGALVMIAASVEPGGPYLPVGHRAPPGFGVYAFVIEAGQPLRVPDLLDDPRVALRDDIEERVRATRQRSFLAVPLRVRERIIGALSVTDVLGRTFSDEDIALLQAFADQAALALENARSHAEVVRRQRETEELARIARLVTETLDLRTVGERIAQSVLGLLGVESSAIRLVGAGGDLEAIALGGRAVGYAGAGAVVPMGVGLVGLAAAEGRPMWTADFRVDERFPVPPAMRERNAAAGTVAGLAVPLRVRGEVIGVLSVGGSTPRAFRDEEIALLQTFADQAALALQNARLFSDGDRRRREAEVLAERLRILHEIDRALIAEQDPTAIAEAVLWRLRDVLGVPRAIVNVFDLAAGEVEWLAAVGRRRIRRGPGVRYSLNLAGDVEALRRGEPQVMDVHALPPGPEAEALLGSGVRAYVVVPMIAGGELIGSVSIGGEQAEFPPEQIGIAQEVATQLAIAIAQARLHERVRQQAGELEVRVQQRTRELEVANGELGQEIAERRRAEQEADRANRAKSEFLSRMSHELRTPLNAILGFAQLLELDELTAEQQDSVGHVLRAGRHLLGLINEVLDISRIEAGRLDLSLEPVAVGATIRQAVELVRPSATAAAVTVEAGPFDAGVHVLADLQRLQQVFLNLLSNAIKYNRAGGTVGVRCEAAAGERIRLLVTDTGRGIAPDLLERLFTPFDRLGADASGIEGTGLGLALTRALVEAMGGVLTVESRVDVGSVFTVELAAAAAPAPVPSSEAGSGAVGIPPASSATDPPRTVLYIEDNLSNLRLVEGILGRRPGLSMISAMQGRVGLDLARDHRPDLVLLDRHLPDVLGDEVFRLLRADPRTRAIPVVMLSADATPATVQRLLDAGVHAYLTKPLDVPSLLAAIDAALGARA